MPSGVLRVLSVHTGSAREAREHQGADPEAKGGAVTIPVYRRRHRGTERGRATFPGHAGQWGGEAAGGREAWLQMVPLGRAERLAPSCPFATRRAAPALLRPRQQGPGPVRPKAQAPWLGGRHLSFPPRRPELSAERSPPASPGILGLGRARFFHGDRCPAPAPGWPRPVHPAARRSDFLLFTDPTGAS